MSELGSFVKRLRDVMRNDAGINGDAQRIEQIAWMLFLRVYDAKEDDWEMDETNYESIIPEICRWRNWAHDDNSGNAMTGDKLLEFVNNILFPVLKGNDVKDSNGVLIEGVRVSPSTPIKKAIVKTTFEDTNQYMKDGVLLRQVLNIIDDIDFSDYKESHAFGQIYEDILKELQSAGASGEYYTPRAVTEFMAQMINPQIGEKMADFACGTGGFITSWLKELQSKVKTTEDQIAFDNSIYGIEKKQFPYMLCVTNMLLHEIDVPKILHDNSLLKDVLDYTDDDKFDVILMNPPYGGSEKNDVKQHFPSDLASSETADLFMTVIMFRLKKNGRCGVVISDGFLQSIDDGAKVNIKKKLLNNYNLHTVIRLPGGVFSPYTDIPTNLLFFDNTRPTLETWFYRLDMPDGYKHFSKTKPMELTHFNCVKDWWFDRKEIRDEVTDSSLVETWKSQLVSIERIVEDGYSLSYCDYPPNEQLVLSPQEVLSNYNTKRTVLERHLNNATHDIQSYLYVDNTKSVSEIYAMAMQLAELNKNFPIELRHSILKAAVKGELTHPCEDDGKVEVTELSDKDNLPFEIPSSWKWSTLDDVCVYIQRGKSPIYSKIKRIPVIAQKCNQWDGFHLEKAQFIDPDSLSTYTEERFLQNHDVLINSTGLGTLGRIAVYLSEGNPYEIAVADSHVTVVRLKKEIMLPEFFYAYWSNPTVQFVVESQATGSTKQKELGLKTLKAYPVPVPPIEEQYRIVEILNNTIPFLGYGK